MTKQKENKPKQKTQNAKGKVTTTMRDFFWGNMVSSNFFSRNIVAVLLVTGLLMLYITFKYECQTHMETIAKLETELSIVKSESIREQSTYKSRTRESTIKQQIDRLNLALQVQEQPPYILAYE